jgi:hypothetical protein
MIMKINYLNENRPSFFDFIKESQIIRFLALALA